MLGDNALRIRNLAALGFCCLGVFIALFAINYNDFMRKLTENNFIEWDSKTVTAGDYTIEFSITPEFYQDYCEKEMENWIVQSQNEGRQYFSQLQSFQFWI